MEGSSRLIVPLNSTNAAIIEYTQVPFVVNKGDLYFAFFPPLKEKGSNENILTSFKILNLPEELTHLSHSVSLVHDGHLRFGPTHEKWRLTTLHQLDGTSPTILRGDVRFSKNNTEITIVDFSDAKSPVCLRTKWPQNSLGLVFESDPNVVFLERKRAIIVRFHDSGHLSDQAFETPMTVMYQMSDILKTSVSYQLSLTRVVEEAPQSQDDVCVYKPDINRIFTIANNSNDVEFSDAREIIVLDNTIQSSADGYPTRELTEVAPYYAPRATMASPSSSSSPSYYVKTEGYEPPTRPTYEHFISGDLGSTTLPPFVIQPDSSIVLRSTNIHPTGNAFLVYESNNLSFDTANDVGVKVIIWMRNEDIIQNVVSTAPTTIHVYPPAILAPDGRKEIPIDDTIYSHMIWNRESEKGTLDSWTRINLPETQNSGVNQVTLIVDSENTDRNTGVTTVSYRIRTFLKSPFVLCIPIDTQVKTEITPQFETFPLSSLIWEKDSRIKYHTLTVPYVSDRPLIFTVTFTPLK
jgi:hypothetical protein